MATVPPLDRQARERERNRAKQQAYRDRQKRIRINALEQTTQDDGSVVVETASLTRSKTKRPKVKPARPPPVKPTGLQSSHTISRMAAKLAELGVDQLEIDRLVSDQRDDSADEEPHGELVGVRPTQPDLPVVRHQRPLTPSPQLMPRRPSTFELTPTSLFAGLLNDALPSPHLQPLLPPTPESTPSPTTVDLLRQALGLSPEPQLPRQLLSYTFNSPVSFENDGRPIDWKVSLFTLHHTCHVQRHHPTKGYLNNPAVREITKLAQTAILQLRGPHYRPHAGQAPFPEYLAPEDEALLASVDDPRMASCHHKANKVKLIKAMHATELDLTEFVGHSIETARFHSDPWYLLPPSFPSSFLASLPPSLKHMVVHATPEEIRTRSKGASLREITLGLDPPGWRVQMEDKEEQKAERRCGWPEEKTAWVGQGGGGLGIGEHLW